MLKAIIILNYIAGITAFLMIPLSCFIAIIWRIQLRMDRVDELYKTIKETVVDETNPNQKDLRALTKFKKFRKDIPEFKEAVRQKLKTYDLVQTTIEKTMSPVQLFKTNNLNVNSIEAFLIINDEYHYYNEMYADAISTIEKQLKNRKELK